MTIMRYAFMPINYISVCKNAIIVRGYIWICGGTTNPINPTRITLSVREGIENLVVTENF